MYEYQQLEYNRVAYERMERFIYYSLKISTFLQLWNSYNIIEQFFDDSLFLSILCLAVFYLSRKVLLIYYCKINDKYAQKDKIKVILYLIFSLEELAFRIKQKELKRIVRIHYLSKDDLLSNKFVINYFMALVQIVFVLNLPEIQNLITILQLLLPLLFSALIICEIQTNNLYAFKNENGLFWNYYFNAKMTKQFLYRWISQLFMIICCCICSQIQNIFKYYIIITIFLVILTMIHQIQYLKRISDIDTAIISQKLFIITLISFSHISIEPREVSDEYYKKKELIQIKCCNAFIVTLLTQKLYIYYHLLIIAPNENIFGFGNYLWIYQLLIILDLFLQTKLLMKYIVIPQFNGPEYFEIYDISNSYYLTENKHKFKNLRFIKVKCERDISLKLILSSFCNCEIIRVGYRDDDNIRKFIESTQYQEVLFLNSIDIKEFEEVIAANSINCNILKIKFDYEMRFQDLLQFSKILVKYDAFVLIINSKMLNKYNFIYSDKFYELQHNLIYIQVQSTICRKVFYQKYLMEFIPLNPAIVLYDLYD
ncbi:transmembrane protein, putative (macronuclear) [Tetrahymena thermophila SB210]|uniref:Transmembrane protein, putative n=1 Tax=Tetrahymena thermophila (strain SB210) TaxID=312017 RepID=W7X3H5_TETTS|nr:transmembrane protein, putative [Tetrahymena thermophila SB210]EWS72007.1 transmembrane protein, putative [Tetrahymena thermophila SB210]|eukprot:XP_012655463.1 transmembrane protein, putative [Tetrahymena thermophila SB210]